MQIANQKREVLLVDDDPNIRRIAEICLSRMGNWNVTLADSAATALELLTEFTPQLIISDVMMGSMDGPTFFKMLRRNSKFDAVPVIFMTAKAQVEEIECLYELGASGVITKPFDPVTLCADVDKFLKYDSSKNSQKACVA